jgi:hypothetical protein
MVALFILAIVFLLPALFVVGCCKLGLKAAKDGSTVVNIGR